MKNLFNTVIGKITKKDDSAKSKSSATEILSRGDLSQYMDKLILTDLQDMVIILIQIDDFNNMFKKYGKKFTSDILKSITTEITTKGKDNHLMTQWSDEELILVCPASSLEESTGTAKRIRYSLQRQKWKKNINVSCSTAIAEVAEEPLHQLVSRLQKALNKPGINKHFVAKAKPKKVIESSKEGEVETEKATYTELDIKAMTCDSTGALNQDGVQIFLQQMSKDALKEMSVVFIDVAQFASAEASQGKKLSELVSKQFIDKMNHICTEEIVARWSATEYLLLCPKTTPRQASSLADNIRQIISQNIWSESMTLKCKTEVYDSNFNQISSQEMEISAEDERIIDGINQVSAA